MKYKSQVKVDYYSFSNYVIQDRWLSYFHQIKSVQYVSELLKKDKLTILEIGVGDGTVSSILKKLGHKVLTADIDKGLNPDYVAVLPELKIRTNKKFDSVVCFEVLEHLRFEDVEKSLERIRQLSEVIVMSIPHKSLYLSLITRVPLIKPVKILLDLPANFLPHKFDGEHYWELGTKNYTCKRFLKVLERVGLAIIKDFRIKEYPYHHFFIVKNKKS